MTMGGFVKYFMLIIFFFPAEVEILWPHSPLTHVGMSTIQKSTVWLWSQQEIILCDALCRSINLNSRKTSLDVYQFYVDLIVDHWHFLSRNDEYKLIMDEVHFAYFGVSWKFYLSQACCVIDYAPPFSAYCQALFWWFAFLYRHLFRIGCQVGDSNDISTEIFEPSPKH